MPPPKSVLDKVIFAVRELKDHKGSSRQAIAKYLKSELATDNAAALKKALKKGVADKKLIQTGQSFTIPGETYEVPESERLVIDDVTVGDGAEATYGSDVTVSYVGKLDSGYTFDSAKTFTFTLGAKDVIKGWDQGVEGMKVGGSRKLTVPPALGYGQKGCSPDIPSGATLHFVVGLKAVE